MSFCTEQILLLASGVYQELNSPTEISVGYISGIFTSSGNLGSLNLKLSTCFWFSGDAPCIAGGFGAEEAAIYALTYQTQYYSRAAHNVLITAGGWTNLSEGDSRVAREGSAQRSKGYLELSKNADQNLRIAVNHWKVAHSIPGQVVAASLASWPTP